MSTPAISQRAQLKADREQQLLWLAQHILQQDGFAGLTMDRLTAVSEFSKGTIYNHFACKEDLFSALSIRSMQQQLQWLQQASLLQGHSRERMLALHCAYYHYACAEPTLFLCLLTANMPAVLEKTSAPRLLQRQLLEQQLTAICTNIIQDAVDTGALALPEAADTVAYSFLNWAYAFGSNLLLKPAQQLQIFAQLQPDSQIQKGLHILLDGMQWLPLSGDWDYQQSWLRYSQQLQLAMACPANVAKSIEKES